jgi:F0F1-type ATP synthase membrane subunit b/b'
MREARGEADHLMAEAKYQALSKKSEIVSARRQEAEKMLAEGREEIRKRTEEARQKLEQESQRFAIDIASQILRRPIQPKRPV